MGAPVIDPIGRYRYAKQLKESGKPYPEFVDMVLPLHDKYWKTEEAMTEGSPVQALERGERVALPPVLYIQDSRDIVHPRAQLERFVELYRKAGGAGGFGTVRRRRRCVRAAEPSARRSGACTRNGIRHRPRPRE